MHLTIFDIYCTCLVAEVFLPISTSFQKSDQQGACCCLDNRDPFRWPFCNEVVGRTLQACHEFQVATTKKVTCAGSAFPTGNRPVDPCGFLKWSQAQISRGKDPCSHLCGSACRSWPRIFKSVPGHQSEVRGWRLNSYTCCFEGFLIMVLVPAQKKSMFKVRELFDSRFWSVK